MHDMFKFYQNKTIGKSIVYKLYTKGIKHSYTPNGQVYNKTEYSNYKYVNYKYMKPTNKSEIKLGLKNLTSNYVNIIRKYK